MTPLELAAMLITAATTLKDAGMPLEKDPSKNFSDLATLVAIAYGENEQGDRIGSGQSTLVDDEGNREISFGPFQINKFWYTDRSASGDTSVVNNKYTDIFDNVKPADMPALLKDPMNSAIAAIIVANSNKGYENWSVYTSDAYGIEEQSFDSKYWKTGFGAAAEQLYKLDIPEVKVTPPFVGSGDFEGGLGQERRVKGFTQREIAQFESSRDKIANAINPAEPTNPETIRQSSLMLANMKGLDTTQIPIDVRSEYSQLDKVILNFLGELAKKKAEG